MAEENKTFNVDPNEPLGPLVGNTDVPSNLPQNYMPFKGEEAQIDPIIFPQVDAVPGANIRRELLGTPYDGTTEQSSDPADLIKALRQNLLNTSEKARGRDQFSGYQVYDNGPDGNAFYERYAAFGDEKLNEIGFHPWRDNDAIFNANTSWFDRFQRGVTEGMWPLIKMAFVEGPKGMYKAAHGDFTSTDLDVAKNWERAVKIGSDTSGGAGAFFNDTVMNFGYTAGILAEILAEQYLLFRTMGKPVKGGGQGISRFLQNFGRAGKAVKNFGDFANKTDDIIKGVTKNVAATRSFRESILYGLNRINPLENTFNTARGLYQTVKGGKNIDNMAILSKTAGSLYRDLQFLNLTTSESRIEAGMVENHLRDDYYSKYVAKTGRYPNKSDLDAMNQLAKKGSMEVFGSNQLVIYLTNKITFGNLAGRGGTLGFFKGASKDIAKIGDATYGTYGKVIFNTAKKQIQFEANNLKSIASAWFREPGFKTAAKTIGYFKRNISEGLQENFQESIARAVESHYKEAFDSVALSRQTFTRALNKMSLEDLEGDSVFGVFNTPVDTYAKELKHEFTSKQGLKTFLSGALMGVFSAPMNAAAGYLNIQFNRMYDQGGYENWKKDKKKTTKNLVNILRANSDINDFLNNRYFNLANQDIINDIKAKANIKDDKDSDLDFLISAIGVFQSRGVSDIMIQKFESFLEMTDKELLDATSKKTGLSDPNEIRTRISKMTAKLGLIKNNFEQVQSMYPNPVNPNNLRNAGLTSEQMLEKMTLYSAWEEAIKNYVYFNESFQDTAKRIKSISESYLQGSSVGSADYSAARVIFRPETVDSQIELLESELDAENQKPKADPKKIASTQKQIEALKSFQSAYDNFIKYYDRKGKAQQAREQLKDELKKEPTSKQIEERLDQMMGNEKDQLDAISKLKTAHDNYIKILAESTNGTILNQQIEDGFHKLLDYYKLIEENKTMAKAIDVFSSPEGFMDMVSRNQAFMKRMYRNKEQYYEKIVKDEIKRIEDNTLLNLLANQGLYVSKEDFAQWVKDKTAPSEIFDHKRKLVYKKGTDEYNSVYNLTFAKADQLQKDNFSSQVTYTDKKYQEQLDALTGEFEKRANELPKENTRVDQENDIELIDGKITLSRLNEELPLGAYVEVKSEGKEESITYYKDGEGKLRFEDGIGNEVNVEEELSFNEVTIYRMQMRPKASLLEALQKEYDAAVEQLEKDYLADKKLEEGEGGPISKKVFSVDDDFKDMPLSLQKQIDESFQTTLSEQDYINLTNEEKLNSLDKYVKEGSIEVKEIIDEYNKKIQEKRDNREKAVKKDFKFIFNDKEIDTAGKESPELRSLLNQVNRQIEYLESQEFSKAATDSELKELKYLKIQAKNLEGVIRGRIRSGWNAQQSAAVKKIEELKSKQPEYKVSSEGYTINGESGFRRVTTVISELLPAYSYRDAKKIEISYKKTLEGKPLNEDNINAFIDDLMTKQLSGFEQYTFKELKSRLTKLSKTKTATEGLIDSKVNLGKPTVDVNIGPDTGIFQIKQGNKIIGDISVSFKGSFKEGIIPKGTGEAFIAGVEIYEDSNKGKGLGAAAYVEVANYMSNLGYTLSSGIDTSASAKRVWESLVKKGLAVKSGDKFLYKQPAKVSLLDTIQSIVQETTYESSREVGNYIDSSLKALFETGELPKFDSSLITQEAYDSLYGEDGILTKIKERVDDGELFIASTGLIVYDEDLKIAGEIDLLVADRNGNLTIVDIKTGKNNKWDGFFKKDNQYSKLKNYGYQQTAYANLLKRMIGVDANIALLPIEVTIDNTGAKGKVLTATKPASSDLLADGSQFLIKLKKDDFATEIDKLIPPVKEVKPGQEGPTLTGSELQKKNFDNFKTEIEKATVDNIDLITMKIAVAHQGNKLSASQFTELADLVDKRKESLQDEDSTQSEYKVGDVFYAKKAVLSQKGKNKGSIFVQQYEPVIIKKLTKNGVVIKPQGKNMQMTLTNDELLDNYFGTEEFTILKQKGEIPEGGSSSRQIEATALDITDETPDTSGPRFLSDKDNLEC